MAPSSILPSTMIDYTDRHSDNGSRISVSRFAEVTRVISPRKGREPTPTIQTRTVLEREAEENIQDVNQEFKLPSLSSLFIIIGGNAVFQVSFFIVVSSASVYAEHLGGSATFSGLTIGIPPLTSGILLAFITRKDGGQYKMPLNISYASTFLGNILYALAYRANWLYLILIGRMVTGLGFIAFMYSKRYCTDPRIVGIRRRTTLASWLVIGQAFGFSAGPFFGGLLYKVGFSNAVFNGVTSPGWIMAVVWIVFWTLSNSLFTDVRPRPVERPVELMAMSPPPVSSPPSQANSDIHLTIGQGEAVSEDSTPSFRSLSVPQWGVTICMCYYAMTCFFILGAWEANIPVFTNVILNYTPFNSGNFIALGGVMSVPFLLINVRYARRLQDRTILAVGTSLGTIGLFLMLSLLKTDKVTFGSLLVCWFLIALGFNLASTCTLSLLSKQLPDNWNRKSSMAIQYSNYTGRVTGAILGGAGVKMGMLNYVGVQLGVVGLGFVMHMTLWKQLKAKTG